jgi:CheY-like chemotaxis protein
VVADVAAPGHNRGRILVVDDDRAFLDMTCRILRLDHEVVGTHDPGEALGRIERGERFDLILCDLMMPTMSGVDLHAAIARFAPHVARRMVFLTAGAFTEKTRAFLASGEVVWLDKLCEPDHLRDVVREHVSDVRA